MTDEVGHRPTRQLRPEAETLGCIADETVDIRDGESGVGERLLHDLPVHVGRIAVAQIALWRHGDTREHGVSKLRHAAMISRCLNHSKL